VSFPYGVTRGPNYNILLERMTYYSRYTTRKKVLRLILDAATKSHMNLKSLIFLRPNHNNHYLVCLKFQLHSIALLVCTQPTRHILPPFTITIHPWDFAKIPPLSRHALDADTDPHVPTYCSFGHLSAHASLTIP
jgi:hypothetical protein